MEDYKCPQTGSRRRGQCAEVCNRERPHQALGGGRLSGRSLYAFSAHLRATPRPAIPVSRPIRQGHELREARIAALAVEEPATAFLSRMHTLHDLSALASPMHTISANLRQYYTSDARANLERKLSRVSVPLVVAYGDRPSDADFASQSSKISVLPYCP